MIHHIEVFALCTCVRDKMDSTYDVIVVGAGMIGSASARYLSENAGLKVCVIGPSEPQVSKRTFQ